MKIRFTILFLFILIGDIMACRYTVREVGFADFGKDSYQFVLFKDGRISDTDALLFRNISKAALIDANIIVKVIDILHDKSSPLLKYYKRSQNGELPNVVLFSPEERVKTFMFEKQTDFMQTVWDIIENIISSDARDELADAIVKSYGVIYFIEGDNAEANRIALKKIDEAVSEMKSIMLSLPHPVVIPPTIITIKAKDRSKENILLWSLGWEETNRTDPAVALMYGRGRRMGNLLSGSFIKTDVVRNMLRFIGEDCECGLDRSWILGTMIPLRWDSKLKASVLAEYGFDADNPIVISEMSQILSIAPTRVNSSIDVNVLYGYSESVLVVSDSAKKSRLPVKKAEKKKEPIKKPAAEITELKKQEENHQSEPSKSVDKIIEPSAIEKPESIESSFDSRDAVGIVLFGFLGIIIVGGIIFVRTKKKNP